MSKAELSINRESAFRGCVYEVRADGFNVFNVDTPINIGVEGDGYGRVTNIPQGRRFRFGARFQF